MGINKIFSRILDKKYHVEFKIYGQHEGASGYLINYNSGNIILFDDKNETIYHIPCKGIEYMFPILPIKHLDDLEDTEKEEDNED